MLVVRLFIDSIKAYLGDRAAIYAAGLAYYALFAVAPLMILVVSVAGLFVGRSVASSQIVEGIQYLVGPDLAAYLGQLAQSHSAQTSPTTRTIFSLVGLALSGAGIFGQLHTAIDDLWGITMVRPKGLQGRLIFIRSKLAPFALIFLLGFLLSASVLIEVALGAVAMRVLSVLPILTDFFPTTNWLLVPILSFLTFSAIFRWLPDAYVRWQDVAVGALVTTIVFLIGRVGLDIYFQRTQAGSIFGTARSVIVLLIWVNVSAHIVLFGAEFTKMYADRFGQPIVPRRLATLTAVPTAEPVANEATQALNK